MLVYIGSVEYLLMFIKPLASKVYSIDAKKTLTKVWALNSATLNTNSNLIVQKFTT